ncbi:hypothetical protein BFL38_06130 [Brachyspira hampsonii]|uniref:Uncharacterized protein n=1 Tax=Brachyspira hampsonii TaxID=1287055 RepID=A0A1E5NE21_9SPIR|nr:hypothetical protein [Brachyspira hampsonii]OEJ14404.1 hypothetical protein BFL38_06130 [Brachyspira hampsonii]
MKKIILILSILSVLAAACSNKDTTAPSSGNKPLTTNVPSDDKTVRDGTPLSSWNGSYQVMNINASVNNAAAGTTVQEYNLLERLYSTTWYQSEEERDEGRLETEEEFVFFNDKSEMVKREYENGIVDGRDDYATLTWIEDITLNVQDDKKNRNACIVRNTEFGKYETDMEYEGYYLVDRDTLYIVDGDDEAEVKEKLNDIISGNIQRYAEDKFVLSTKPLN